MRISSKNKNMICVSLRYKFHVLFFFPYKRKLSDYLARALYYLLEDKEVTVHFEKAIGVCNNIKLPLA